MSDGTHLSNFAGDKKEWPVYMIIGNLSSKIRQMPSAHTVVMVALLPIPIKNRNIPQKRLDEQRQTNREVLNEVLRRVLQPLTFKLNPSAESGYYNVLCADGNFRRCKPVLAGWLADGPEYSELHHLERHVCFGCECPKNELGDYVPSDKQHPRSVRNGSRYGPGGYYRSVWQRPYPIKNRRFFKRTIALWLQILIREFSVWYIKYVASYGASFGRLRFSISLNLSKRQPKNLVFTPKMTIISKPLAEF